MYDLDISADFKAGSSLSIDPDIVPSNINLSTISFIGRFLSAPLVSIMRDSRTTANQEDSGEGVTILSYPATLGDDQGWTTVETVIVRLDTFFTLDGRFPIYVNRTVPYSGRAASFGYDAAVCVRRYEPWIVETYNTSNVSPSVLRIVGKGNRGASPSPSGNIRGPWIANTRDLTATGKFHAFYAGDDNSVNQALKDNGRYGYYAPSLTVGPAMIPIRYFF